MPVDFNSDRDVLARTLDGEAENQPMIGQQAIAVSILKRVAQVPARLKVGNHQFGDGTIRGACLAPDQYDCWLPGPDRDRIEALDIDNPTPAFAQCIKVADAAIGGQLPTFGNPTHYFEEHIPAPFWVSGAIFCGEYGVHLFWRNVK